MAESAPAAPTVLDLFAGACGGWSLGLHRAGYRTVAACEIDPWRRAAFLANFPGVEMWDDVRAVSARSLRGRLGYMPDVIVGSPPCQDASVANPGGIGIEGKRTGLFMEALRIIDECRPAWACLENAPAFRVRGADRVLGALEALGYAYWPLVVGAGDFGAPHLRRRVWIVAADPDRQLLREPEQRMPEGWSQDRLRDQGHPFPPDGLPPAWSDPWSDGGDLREADGLPGGVADAARAAYGDAVVPQVAETLGWAMRDLIGLS